MRRTEKREETKVVASTVWWVECDRCGEAGPEEEQPKGWWTLEEAPPNGSCRTRDVWFDLCPPCSAVTRGELIAARGRLLSGSLK